MKEVSHHKTFYIETTGCQMNVYDSFMIEKILNSIGYKMVSTCDEADVVILNTCNIREKATEKIYSALGAIKKRQNRNGKKSIFIVSGCVAQAEGDIIQKRNPDVDIIVGPQDIQSIPVLLHKILSNEEKIAISLNFDPIKKFDYLEQHIQTSTSFNQNISAFLTIQEGCDKFCTYCVVPYTRGVEYSRPVEKIYQEAVKLVQNGAKEITLLGQNVNAYRSNFKGKEFNLAIIIKELAKIERLERIRYITSHPNDMHEELYEVHAEEKKLMPYFHLPIQSGSNKILKSMNRKHTVEQYIEIVRKMREYRPNICLSSDFIVGFAGETEADFEDTLALVKEVHFSQAFSFKYSIRHGTVGATFPNQVDEQIKAERLVILQDLLKKQQIEYNKSFISKTVNVLFDQEKNDQIRGKTEYMQSVYTTNKTLLGKNITLKVINAYQNSLDAQEIEYAEAL